jgi:hypothetical protein
MMTADAGCRHASLQERPISAAAHTTVVCEIVADNPTNTA